MVLKQKDEHTLVLFSKPLIYRDIFPSTNIARNPITQIVRNSIVERINPCMGVKPRKRVLRCLRADAVAFFA